MKPKILIINTLSLDAALMSRLPRNNPAALGTAPALTLISVITCGALLRVS